MMLSHYIEMPVYCPEQYSLNIIQCNMATRHFLLGSLNYLDFLF